MSQPFIYTLPEQFIEDKSVPLHWKLYTLVNGFWIAGKPVFASNAFFADKLKCTERNVQLCLVKLEKMGLLERVGRSQNRRITPAGGRTRTSSPSKRDEATVRAGGEATVRHISDSNSDSKTPGDAERRGRFTSLGADLIKEFEAVDPKNKTYYSNTSQRAAADFLIETYGFEEVKKRIGVLGRTNKLPYFPTITTPVQLRDKWVPLQDAVERLRSKSGDKKPKVAFA